MADDDSTVTVNETASDSRKRPATEEADEKPTKKPMIGAGMAAAAAAGLVPAQSPDYVFALKCCVSNDHAGSIIGKGGRVINEIISTTGCKLKLSQSNEHFPGTQLRVILITGDSKEQIMAGFAAVLQRCYEAAGRSSKRGAPAAGAALEGAQGQVDAKILVPNAVCGLIIGRGGENIKQIIAQSSARVQLASKDQMVPGVSERMVTFTGSCEQQIVAARLTYARMLEDKSLSKYAQMTTTYQAAAPAARAPYGGYGSPVSSGFGAMGYAGPAPQAMGGFRRPPPMAMGGIGMRGAHMGGMPPPMAGMGAPMGAGTMGGGAATASIPVLGAEGTTITVSVKDDIVGAIVGRGGQSINEMQQYSGARIKISQKGEFVPGTQNRIVTISGTTEACQTAQYLIQQCLLNSQQQKGGQMGRR